MLTELQIENFPKPESRREVPDGKIAGLYLVLQPSGAKSWALRYRVAGAPKKFTIGPYPAISLAAARKKAQKALGEVVDGTDPSATKKAAREAARAANSTADRVEAIVDSFVTRHLAKNVKPSWAKEAERLLRVEIIPIFGKRRLGDITPRDVDKLLSEIAERAPITANRALAVFRKMSNWAASPRVGLIHSSPCAGVEAPTAERSRERVLTDDEIRLAWTAFGAIGWPFGLLAKLLLLTGARRDEVASMRWSEVDLVAKTWSLPGARTKNKRPHEIPLSDAAVAIVKSLPRVAGDTGFVFSTTGRTAVSGFSRAKSAIDAAMLELAKAQAEAAGRSPDDVQSLPGWTLHDLRRTVATNLQKLGVKLEVTEAVLNHVSGSRSGIVGVYQRHQWTDEKRAALDAWARKLQSIVSGEAPANVVQLSSARAGA
ncbi:tyrosine-type recombinase/integrase [Rhodoblastus sp.]|uniref:tyrosine-type recombinase/integrase n=1 Tax=Rhodoblastus sp. TaxID=1962975 RepID=UPI003F9C1FC6